MKTWISILTAAVVLLGIGYLNLYCSEMKFNSDSAGVIISALGVLVTALVGWQIYSLIDLKQIRQEHDGLREEVNINVHHLHIDLHSSVLAAYKGLIQASEDNDIRKAEFLIVLNYLRLFYHKIALKEFDDCNVQINMMFNDVERRNPIELTKDENTLLHELIGDINGISRKMRFNPVRPLTDIFDYIVII